MRPPPHELSPGESYEGNYSLPIAYVNTLKIDYEEGP